ncbi:MAG: hypothetical protein KGI71_06185 [Patescibacteria group bacterium]|nr:hypothetical protein [Patescibacteria group bacterium]
MKNTMKPETHLLVDGEPCTWGEFLAVNCGPGQLGKKDLKTIRGDLERQGWCRWDFDLMIRVENAPVGAV